MCCSKNTYKLLVLSKVKGINSKKLKLISQLSDFHKKRVDYKKVAEFILQKSIDALNIKTAIKLAKYDKQKAKKFGVKIISFLDENIPTFMEFMDNTPAILYIKGSWHKENRYIGVVGARNPTEDGKKSAKKVSEEFSKKKYSIVSGLVAGCDTIAHKVALKNKMHSVGVLAHSFETKMTKESEDLAKEILDNGGILVSQYPFGITPKAFSYMQKNRLQALLSEAVVLVQASLKSEALYFAKTILQEGQKLFVVPPSQKDIDNNEVNIEVNQVIVSKDSYEIKKLLFCDCKTLQNIIIMENKDDKYS